MPLHPVVQEIVAAYLDAVDTALPGHVEGLYLVGSAVLGDFRPQASDIDYLAVTSAPLDETAYAALNDVHAGLRQRWQRPFFDGSYVTWDDLARDPAVAAPAPYSHEGQLHPRRDGPCDPVTWHTLAHHGVSCRGPAPADVDVWTDPAVLRAWVLDNLHTYWGRLLYRATNPTDLWAAAAFTPYVCLWVVTGVSRMHYTLATGDICSKEGAAQYALATFPERWHRVVKEALRIRRADFAGTGLSEAIAATVTERVPLRWPSGVRSLYRTPWSRRRDVLAFGQMVIADVS